MKLRAVKSSISARTDVYIERPKLMGRCEKLVSRVWDALWCGRGPKAIEMMKTFIASLKGEMHTFPRFFELCAGTAVRAAETLLSFLQNNNKDLIDYRRARAACRRVSSASAESVMNHLINRRCSKRQQMRWSIKGVHYLLQTRVELLDGRLAECFSKRFEHFKCPDL